MKKDLSYKISSLIFGLAITFGIFLFGMLVTFISYNETTGFIAAFLLCIMTILFIIPYARFKYVTIGICIGWMILLGFLGFSLYSLSQLH
ncbi:hypothetical protein KORDIASMS9_04578 [Kordia sp. SMS9]|uniref:hypothetical protein n=1 Tax=Kordia sp. SMS9 TaxID=2282170 RepID=UPI000E0D94E3|nr:hypothetical protein [Kordia sp. SMS9]AXG72307.1 hypothetical protein KORDIASMS9_04578 [Kordia sp. SMS9]